MENPELQLSPVMQSEIDQLIKKHKAEKLEWKEKNEQLAQSYRSLEQENNLLQAKLELAEATEEGRSSLNNKWAEENAALKDRLAEHDYLQDIVEEKKSQIAFLQNQLEQRVILHHSTGHQMEQLQNEIQQLNDRYAGVIRELEQQREQLQLSTEANDNLNTELAGKEEQLQAISEKLRTQQQRIRKFYEESAVELV